MPPSGYLPRRASWRRMASIRVKAAPIAAFPNTAQRVRGEIHEGPEPNFRRAAHPPSGQPGRSGPRRSILDGWFQRYEYYRPSVREFEEWLAFDPPFVCQEAEARHCHTLRRTDYVPFCWAFRCRLSDDRNVLPQAVRCGLARRSAMIFLRKFSAWKPKFFSGSQ